MRRKNERRTDDAADVLIPKLTLNALSLLNSCIFGSNPNASRGLHADFLVPV